MIKRCDICDIDLTEMNQVSSKTFIEAKIKYGFNYHDFIVDADGQVRVCNRCFLREKLQVKHKDYFMRESIYIDGDIEGDIIFSSDAEKLLNNYYEIKIKKLNNEPIKYDRPEGFMFIDGKDEWKKQEERKIEYIYEVEVEDEEDEEDYHYRCNGRDKECNNESREFVRLLGGYKNFIGPETELAEKIRFMTTLKSYDFSNKYSDLI